MARIYKKTIKKCWDCPHFITGLLDRQTQKSLTSDKCELSKKEISFIDPSKEIAIFCELEEK